MRLPSHAAVCRYIQDTSLQPAQLAELRKLLDDAERRYQQQNQGLQAETERLRDLADEMGLSLNELLTRIGVTSGAVRQKRPTDWRRPFMDPLDPNSGCYAISRIQRERLAKGDSSAVPDWVHNLLSQGWQLEELRYDRHAAAMRARGQEPLYDAVARYKHLRREATGWAPGDEEEPEI